jgi:hypothetical protein
VVSTGCPSVDVINPVCQLGTVVGGVGGDVASAGIDAVLGGLSHWVASGAEWLLGQIGAVLVSSTSVDLGADWFRHNYQIMTGLAGVVVLPLLLVTVLQAIYRQSPAVLLRAFFIQLPLALLLGVVAVQIVILCLSATDAMCATVAGGAGSSVTVLLSTLSTGLVAAVADPGLASFVLLLVGLLVAAAAFVLWLELLVRAAAVYVAALFLPLALVTLVWPAVSHWCRRLVETLAALILSKFVIVATLSLAAGAVASGLSPSASSSNGGGGGGGAGGSGGFASVLAGGALLVLATFVPFAILRLIPMVEAGAVSHLEGARQRGTAALTRIPKSAASFALKEGMESLGAARVMAKASAAGGVAGAASRGVAGSSGGGGEGSSGEGAEPAPLNAGEPGSVEDAVAAVSTPRPEGRGPKPVVGWQPPTDTPAGQPSSEAEVLPDDFKGWLYPPEPGKRRYYMGRDDHGGVIRCIPPAPTPPSTDGP